MSIKKVLDAWEQFIPSRLAYADRILNGKLAQAFSQVLWGRHECIHHQNGDYYDLILPGPFQGFIAHAYPIADMKVKVSGDDRISDGWRLLNSFKNWRSFWRIR